MLILEIYNKFIAKKSKSLNSIKFFSIRIVNKIEIYIYNHNGSKNVLSEIFKMFDIIFIFYIDLLF